MPNYIQYSTSIPSGSLKKGNAALGITDSVAGPTSNTGWYTGINPPTGSYTVYEVSASGDPDIYCPINSTELINLVKSKGATGGNTGSVADALAWIATQPNLLATNEVYPNIVTSGSVLNLDAGFVGSYPTTASTWYDVSGNNNSGSLINGPTFNSLGYLNFDGIDDYVNCGNNSNLNFTTNFTIGAWMNANSVQASVDSGILGKITSNDAYSGYMLWFQSNKNVTLYIRGNYINSTFSLSSNTWYYVVGTYNGTTASLYINGVLNSSMSLSISANAAASNFWVGQYEYTTGGRNFTGKIAMSQAYNRALTQAEILQNYYQAPIVTNGLVFAADAGNLVSYESGSTITYSLTGSASGSLVNGTGYSNINNGTWVFDGIDDYISIPDINFTTATIDIWVYINAYGASGTVFVYQSNGGFEVWSDLSGLIRYNKNPSVGLTSGSGFTRNSWNNIVATSDGTVNKLYLNNINIGSTNGGIFDNTNGDIRISGYNSYMVNGRCPILKMYNRALSQEEVQQNFNAQKSRFGF